MNDYEELILLRQELNDEDYDTESKPSCNRSLEEVYPDLFHKREVVEYEHFD